MRNLRALLAGAAIAALASLALVPAAASAAPQAPAAVTAHHAATHPAAPLISFSLCLANSPGEGACLTSAGQGVQAQIGSGANLTESNCGQQGGQNVFAWKNANNLWVHFLTSNGRVTFDNNPTNGCSNHADEWIQDPQNGEIYSPWNNINYNLGCNGDSQGTKVFAGGSPGWDKWADVG